MPEQTEAAVRLFQTMCGWTHWPVGDTPRWPTDITDDGTPFEYSVAFGRGTPKIRLLAEAQRAPIRAKSSWMAGLRLTARLARLPNVDVARFDRIKDLFAPSSKVPARFSVWHAASLDDDGSASFKVYLNPQILGPGASVGLVHEAFTRLNMPGAFDAILPCLSARGDKNRLVYFSLDLAATEDARVKVYIAHDHATVGDIESDLRRAPGYTRGDARSWIGQLLESEGPFNVRPVLSCLALTSGSDRPAVTVHVPVRCYVPNDAHVVSRTSPLLGEHDSVRFREALDRLSGRPLEVGRGLVTYVSVRRLETGLNVTTYLAPEAYAISAPRHSEVASRKDETPAGHSMIRALRPATPAEPSRTMADVELVIHEKQAELARHPFLRRLDSTGTFGDVRVMAPRLTFFVLCFQDMLRLVHARVSDPEIKDMAKVHELEDKGHEKWFLHDLEHFGIPIDLVWVFGTAHETTRDLSYEIVAEVLESEDDRARLAVVLSLEGAGHEFFGRVIGFLERIGHDDGLQYFARRHQQIEESHDVFACDGHAKLAGLGLSPPAFERSVRAVHRTFAAVERLATHLEGAIVATSKGQLRADALLLRSHKRSGQLA